MSAFCWEYFEHVKFELGQPLKYKKWLKRFQTQKAIEHYTTVVNDFKKKITQYF